MGWWVGGCVYLDYNVSSGPFLSFEIEIRDGPGPKLDNFILVAHIDPSVRTNNKPMVNCFCFCWIVVI